MDRRTDGILLLQRCQTRPPPLDTCTLLYPLDTPRILLYHYDLRHWPSIGVAPRGVHHLAELLALLGQLVALAVFMAPKADDEASLLQEPRLPAAAGAPVGAVGPRALAVVPGAGAQGRQRRAASPSTPRYALSLRIAQGSSARCAARPPFALERPEGLDQQRVLYPLAKPRRDGATAATRTPLELIDQLGTLIPAPGLHRHGLASTVSAVPGARSVAMVAPARTPVRAFATLAFAHWANASGSPQCVPACGGYRPRA